ncbi:hypothetical protein NFI96_009268 [Prochilodus magdalenae]|nr:hypothetical protein NFI96_009268 [Prochilodus magdalenae]
MRHIHVELVRKEPAQAGGDPGLQGAGPRPFSQEELRLQKVYQLSIFSQRGGFSEGRAALRPGMKRPLQDEEDDDDEDDDLEGEVLCGASPRRGLPDEAQQGSVSHKRPLQDEEVEDDEECDGEVLRDSDTPRSPLSPTHTPPSRKLARPVLDAFAPLSPKSPPMLDPQAPPHSFSPWGISEGSPPPAAPRTEASTAGDNPPWSADGSRDEGCSISERQIEAPTSTSCILELQGPSQPSLTPAEAVQWGASLESSPPAPDRRSLPSSPPSWSNGTSPTDKEKSPAEPPRAVLGVKKKLLSSSDTGESCSEDEGPSTSKRSRLALLTPGLGLAAGRSTDSKAAPYWTHLLPTTREQGKELGTCFRNMV